MSVTTTVLRSFHGDPELKARYVEKLQRHHEADELVQGSYWDKNSGRGCAVGCTIEGDDHARYEEILGLPEWLAHIEDRIFEGLPISEAKDFARDFLAVIPVDSDLSRVRWQFQAFVMGENLRVVESLDIDAKPKDLVIKVITDVKALNEKAASASDGPIDSQLSSARSAASSAASSAWAARSSESAVWSSAMAAAWQKYAARLLDLLRNAEMPVKYS